MHPEAGWGGEGAPSGTPTARPHHWDTGRGFYGLRDPRPNWRAVSYMHLGQKLKEQS